MPDQINEELEYRIGMMETSLSRFGMILDSIQSDIMQVNKGRKELALESKYFCGWIKPLIAYVQLQVKDKKYNRFLGHQSTQLVLIISKFKDVPVICHFSFLIHLQWKAFSRS